MNTLNQTGNGNSFDYEAMINGLISLCDDTELVICLDRKGLIKHIKKTAKNELLYRVTKLVGQCMWDLLPPEIAESRREVFNKVLDSGRAIRFEDVHDGNWFDSMVYPVFDQHKRVVQVLVLGRDITISKHAEIEIKSLNEQLEQRVAERTVNLEEKARTLEDLNVTLRVLLQKREEDKTQLEEQVMSNIRQIITPYLEKLMQSTLAPQPREVIRTIQANLSTITSSFSHRLTCEYLNMTPKEIQIASLIKDGKSTKEIAEFMNTALKTIEVHREHIRQKLNIKNRSVNLRTHLLSSP